MGVGFAFQLADAVELTLKAVADALHDLIRPDSTTAELRSRAAALKEVVRHLELTIARLELPLASSASGDEDEDTSVDELPF